MRCYVHTHFGDEIDIPDFLLEGDSQDDGFEVPAAPGPQPAPQRSFDDFEAISGQATRTHGFEEATAQADQLNTQHHRALRSALRLMIDATGRHADVSVNEARDHAIQALARVDAESGATNTLVKGSLLNKLGRWLCSM
jgi:hypothetical protein